MSYIQCRACRRTNGWRVTTRKVRRRRNGRRLAVRHLHKWIPVMETVVERTPCPECSGTGRKPYVGWTLTQVSESPSGGR